MPNGNHFTIWSTRLMNQVVTQFALFSLSLFFHSLSFSLFFFDRVSRHFDETLTLYTIRMNLNITVAGMAFVCLFVYVVHRFNVIITKINCPSCRFNVFVCFVLFRFCISRNLDCFGNLVFNWYRWLAFNYTTLYNFWFCSIVCYICFFFILPFFLLSQILCFLLFHRRRLLFLYNVFLYIRHTLLIYCLGCLRRSMEAIHFDVSLIVDCWSLWEETQMNKKNDFKIGLEEVSGVCVRIICFAFFRVLFLPKKETSIK